MNSTHKEQTKPTQEELVLFDKKLFSLQKIKKKSLKKKKQDE